MGLREFFKNRIQSPAGEAAEPAPTNPDPAAPVESPPANEPPQLAQWLSASHERFATADAKAPPTSQTSVAAAREILLEFLPLDDAGSISFLEMLLMCAQLDGVHGVGLADCPACGQRNVLIGLAGEPKFKCQGCQQPLEFKPFEYSREVGAAIRQVIAPAHVRCLAALSEMGFDEAKAEAALTVARTAGHAKAIFEIDRRQFAERLGRQMLLASLSKTALQKSPDGSLSGHDGSTIPADQTEIMIDALLWQLSVLANQAAEAGHVKLAITALEMATDIRQSVLLKFPKSVPLRFAQAADLDELGVTLRKHQPARRLGALGLVKQAAEMLAALDRDDAAGREARKAARDEVAQHLTMSW